MKLQHYVMPALVAAAVALTLTAAPPAVADPVDPYACSKEWLRDHDNLAMCDNDQTKNPVSPDGPGGPGGPGRPGGPGGRSSPEGPS